MEGAHPAIMDRLLSTNMMKTSGYGTDQFSEAARQRIRQACRAPEADIFFLVGGTQTNATVIDAMLASYQGVIAADTGHISIHEAAAIEAGGHKVLLLPQHEGKLQAKDISHLIQSYWEDENHEHMVMPGMVYLSQPTESGTLYSLSELEAISSVCRQAGIPLYLDGARLAYALACPENDASLADIARLCEVFYIGGTKCGALFGEAVVFPRHNTVPHFFTQVKQHGALLAKGRLTGLMFDTLFTDGLYERIGQNAIQKADQIRRCLHEAGYSFYLETPTNQIFILLTKQESDALCRLVTLDFWAKLPDDLAVMRIATSWATTQEDTDALCSVLKKVKK